MSAPADPPTGPSTQQRLDAEPRDAEPIALWVVRHLSTLPAKTRNPLPEIVLVVGVFAAIQYSVPSYGLLRGLLWPTLVMLVLVIAYDRFRKRGLAAAPEGSVTLPEPQLNARLIVRGNRPELAAMTQLRNVPFEPLIFERIYAARSFWWIFWIGGLLGAAVLVVVERVFRISLRGTLGGTPQVAGIVVVWMMARLRPTYYRIVPGRLDIMWFAALAHRGGVRMRVDLRSAKIVADFANRTLELDTRGNLAIIPLFGISEPHRFVQAVFQAAISTFPAPPLPDDSLLG